MDSIIRSLKTYSPSNLRPTSRCCAQKPGRIQTIADVPSAISHLMSNSSGIKMSKLLDCLSASLHTQKMKVGGEQNEPNAGKCLFPTLSLFQE